MTIAELRECIRLAAAATPGPWVVGVSRDRDWGINWPVLRIREMVTGSDDEAAKNAMFVQHARTALPAAAETALRLAEFIRKHTGVAVGLGYCVWSMPQTVGRPPRPAPGECLGGGSSCDCLYCEARQLLAELEADK